jgi:polysaccharide export outer membrane protein
MKIKKILLVAGLYCLLIVSLLTSCSTQKINKDYIYFQRGLDSIGTIQPKEIAIKTNDLLSIKVGSRSLNQEQTRLFNIGSGDSSSATYTVNSLGNIEMPMIGNIKAAGLSLVQLQTVLTEKLVNYVKDPVVKVKYSQFTVNILGQVNSPGIRNFTTENVNILDAIGSAGDLTDFAKREDIMVIREENGKRRYFKVDLKSGGIFQSPVYQLQPHDLIYVPANKNKLLTINQDPNQGKTLSTVLTVTSLIITITSIVLFAIRR